MARDSTNTTIRAASGSWPHRTRFTGPCHPPTHVRLDESGESGRLREERLEVVVERLCLDYPWVALAEVVELVRTCREQIDAAAPPATVAELVERLARQRLPPPG